MAKKKDEPRCGNCAYFYLAGALTQCRRHPPKIGKTTTYSAFESTSKKTTLYFGETRNFPHVMEHDWCGDFELKR